LWRPFAIASGVLERMVGMVNPESVIRKLKFDYLKAKNDSHFKSMEVMTLLLSRLQRSQFVIHDLIQEAANQIQRQYKLRYTLIGLRGLSDGTYRYEVMSGMRPDAWTSQKARTYKRADFELHTQNYNAGELSKYSRVYLEEVNPLGEDDLKVLNRPVLHGTRRKEEDEALEADFIDTLILGPADDLLGWIEYSGTITGEFPPAIAIKSIEVMAGILSIALVSQGYAMR
jgi:hypothetical protein